MKKIVTVLLLATLSLGGTAFAKEKITQTLIGKITAFECGDNCYLTLVDSKGKEHQGLCADRVICEKLLTSSEPNLGGYKGKKVKATVSQGKQFDGAGNVMGTMAAFTKLEILK